MMSYTHQSSIWSQWDKAVDFASPVTAWTTTMLEVVRDMGRPTTLEDVDRLRDEVQRRDKVKRGEICPECDSVETESNGQRVFWQAEYRCCHCDHRWGMDMGTRYGY
jgi:hypothetical protein